MEKAECAPPGSTFAGCCPRGGGRLAAWCVNVLPGGAHLKGRLSSSGQLLAGLFCVRWVLGRAFLVPRDLLAGLFFVFPGQRFLAEFRMRRPCPCPFAPGGRYAAGAAGCARAAGGAAPACVWACVAGGRDGAGRGWGVSVCGPDGRGGRSPSWGAPAGGAPGTPPSGGDPGAFPQRPGIVATGGSKIAHPGSPALVGGPCARSRGGEGGLGFWVGGPPGGGRRLWRRVRFPAARRAVVPMASTEVQALGQFCQGARAHSAAGPEEMSEVRSRCCRQHAASMPPANRH